MPNPPEPDHGRTPRRGDRTGERALRPENTAERPMVWHDPETETEVISQRDDEDTDTTVEPQQEPERRFTAPGFDAKETTVIATPPEQPTEVIPTPGDQGAHAADVQEPPKITRKPSQKAAVPQSIPARDGAAKPQQSDRRINWGWVLALVVVILALAAIAILGTVWFTRGKHHAEATITAAVAYDTAVRSTV
jgi:hypothetical protein